MPFKRRIVRADCVVCGREFGATFFHSGYTTKTCGRDCLRATRKIGLASGPDSPSWKGGVPRWICNGCGVAFRAYHKKAGAPRVYCSRPCANLANAAWGYAMRARLAFEHKAIRMLQDEGYACIRSAGSRGPVDVFAFNATELRLIQVKSTKKALEERAVASMLTTAAQDLLAIPGPDNVSRWLYLRHLRRNWIRICVDEYPTDRAELHAQIKKALLAWRDYARRPDVREIA